MARRPKPTPDRRSDPRPVRRDPARPLLPREQALERLAFLLRQGDPLLRSPSR